MKEYRNVISRTVRQLLLCGGLLLASCSQDNDLTDTSLPEGMYPLELTASIVGTTASSTRSTTDGSWKWDGTEKVAVRVSTSPTETEYTLHQYTVKPSGSGVMVSDKPYYWQNTSSIWLRAWYPYQETLSSFTVPADQSTEAGFQQADFLCTEITNELFNTLINIDFYHQTAKVVVNIKKEGIMADSPKATVTLGCDDNNNKLYLTGSMDPVDMSPPTNYSGLTANTDGGQDIIHPLAIKTTTDSEYAATYQALLIPQDIGGKKFIAITVGGITCYYIPPTGTTLEGGYSYTYNVTLNTEGEVTVNNITVSSWTNHEGDIPLETE